jgi:hypothetical protein
LNPVGFHVLLTPPFASADMQREETNLRLRAAK